MLLRVAQEGEHSPDKVAQVLRLAATTHDFQREYRFKLILTVLKFSASILGRETPSMTAAASLRRVRRPPVSASLHLRRLRLVAEDTQFYLGHVQPTAVYWSVVEFQALGDPRSKHPESL